LSSITSSGLDNIPKLTHTVMFEEHFPASEIRSDLMFYCPLKFNYRGIGGIVVRFDLSRGKKTCKETCFMFPFHVTVAKSHSDSEQSFFGDWSMCVRTEITDYCISRRLWVLSVNIVFLFGSVLGARSQARPLTMWAKSLDNFNVVIELLRTIVGIPLAMTLAQT
jgi:hypothetical protein